MWRAPGPTWRAWLYFTRAWAPTRRPAPGTVRTFTNPEATENGKKFKLPLAYNAEADKQSKAEAMKFFSVVLRR